MTVLYVDTHDCANCRDERAGVRRFARAAGWTCVFGRALGVEAVRAEIEQHRPDGCIIECSLSPQAYPPRTFGRLPVVYLDCRPDAYRDAICKVTHDSEETGRRGAQELLKSGMDHYAYVGYRFQTYWSRLRERGFVQTMRKHGFEPMVFDGHCRRPIERTDFRPALRKWCERLPPKVGVMAANDEIGVIVLDAFSKSGRSVPEDAVVIGVDNDEIDCARARPALSSMKIDFEQAGFRAADLLERLFSSGSVRKVGGCCFCSLGIIRRRSTGNCGRDSPAMVRAVEFIRERASLGITVRDVVAETGLSPRVAEMRYREMTGRSIRDEIMLTRFEQVFQMLRNGSIAHNALADACGFRSVATLRKEFRRRTGVSISDWCRK